MKDIDIKSIIQEEIAKMYEDTDLLSNHLDLKESVLKFNRLMDESFDNLKTVIDKLDKYNLSSSEKMQKEIETLRELKREFESINTVLYTKLNGGNLTEEEEIEIESLYDKFNKTNFLVSTLIETLEKMSRVFMSLEDEVNSFESKSAKIEDVNDVKIFLN